MTDKNKARRAGKSAAPEEELYPRALRGLYLRPCVGIALFNAQGQVWAGRRLKKSAVLQKFEAEKHGAAAAAEMSLWQLPQGGIEPREEPLAAARRELWEETGIKKAKLLAQAPHWLAYALPAELVNSGRGGGRTRFFNGAYQGQKQKWFAFLYQGDESEIAINPPPKADETEFDAWGWRRLEDIAAHIIFFKREVYRQMAAEFAPVAAQLQAKAERIEASGTH